MKPVDDEFVLRPKRSRFRPRERSVRGQWIVKRGVVASRTFAARALAKMTYVDFANLKGANAAAHVRYLQRESAQSHGLEVDREFGTCSSESFLKPLKGEKRVYKLVLSPQEFFSLDPKVYVHSVMHEILRRAGIWESGQTADWRAFVHTNTGNPHIHVLIHGSTRDGRDLYFKPHVIKDATPLATRVQNRMTSWFPVSSAVADERRRALDYGPMPTLDGINLDTKLQQLSGRANWNTVLDSVPFFRRRALHTRMVMLEDHGLLRQTEEGVLVASDVNRQLETLHIGLGQVREKARLKCLTQPPFQLAHTRSPLAFGLLTPVLEIGLKRHRYTVLETTKGTAIAIRLADDQVDLVNRLAKNRTLVRLKNGRPQAFRGDPQRLIRVALHSTGPVAQEVLGRTQAAPLDRAVESEIRPSSSALDFGN